MRWPTPTACKDNHSTGGNVFHIWGLGCWGVIWRLSGWSVQGECEYFDKIIDILKLSVIKKRKNQNIIQMENQSKKSTLNFILIVIAVGIWAIVFQNAGIIPTNQNVKVVNEIDAKVRGSVDAEVSGSVQIGNTVDINIEAINGKSNAFYDHNYDGNHNRIPVYTGN